MRITEPATMHNESSPWQPEGTPGSSIVRGIVRSPSHVALLEEQPSRELLAGQTLLECIQVAARIDPEKAAILQMLDAEPDGAFRAVTYRELVARIVQSANRFHALAAGEPPSVVVIAPFLPEALIATWGAATAGSATPINPALDSKQIASIMNAVRANILVTIDKGHGPGAWDRLHEITPHVPTLRCVLKIDSAQADDFLAVIDESRPDELDFAPNRDPEAVVAHIPTGGTTGAPKLVRLTNRGQLLNAWLFGSLSVSGPDEVVGHAMPNFHVGGLVALALRAMIFGQTLLTLTPLGFRNPDLIKNFWHIARRFRMTNIIMAPTTVAALLNQSEGTSEGHSFKSFICGGSTIPLELLNDFHARTGIYLRETWGMTEFQGPCSGHPANDERPVVGSVGIAYPYYKVKAAQLEGTTFVADLKAGERGVLIVSGPTITPGYVDDSLTPDLFVKGMPDGEVWASTGDLGTVDEDGYIWVYGREKDLIIRGGNNIDPKIIEDALATHPSVLMSAAIGRPDPSRGEMPMAYVQLKSGESTSAAELLAFCRLNILDRAAVPVEVVIVPAMPMTAVGKMAKPTLRIDAMRSVTSEVAQGVFGCLPFGVEIDETGKRPVAVVKADLTDVDGPRREQLLQAFRSAFAGFSFKAEVR